jgi:hypothetical protein
MKEAYKNTLLSVCPLLTPMLGSSSVNTPLTTNTLLGVMFPCGPHYVKTEYVLEGKWVISSSQNFSIVMYKVGASFLLVVEMLIQPLSLSTV